jgi:hypothetical protein
MMITLEFHDNDVNNVAQGTLCCAAGKQGTISYYYQAEMTMQEILEEKDTPVSRVFVIVDREVVAVVYRNSQGNLYYSAKTKRCIGEWKLPFVDPKATAVVTKKVDVGTCIEDGEVYAREVFKDDAIACVVMVDGQGVLAAWERGKDGVVLVTRGRARSLK